MEKYPDACDTVDEAEDKEGRFKSRISLWPFVWTRPLPVFVIEIESDLAVSRPWRGKYGIVLWTQTFSLARPEQTNENKQKTSEIC